MLQWNYIMNKGKKTVHDITICIKQPIFSKGNQKEEHSLHLNSKCVWIRKNIWSQDKLKSIPVVLRPREWVCGRSLAGTAGSNPTGIMCNCLLSFVCCQVEVSALGWSPRPYESCRVLCHWVWTWSLDNERSWPNIDCRAMEKEKNGKLKSRRRC